MPAPVANQDARPFAGKLDSNSEAYPARASGDNSILAFQQGHITSPFAAHGA
jgi:hypothetical protein